MSKHLLEVRNLTTEFNTRNGVARAVDNVSFCVEPGEIVGLVGESGSGKSVTGYSILNLIDPPGRLVSGSIKFNDHELVGLTRNEMRAILGKHISMIFQDPMSSLNPVLNIFSQMQLALKAHMNGASTNFRQLCLESLKKVGIPDPEQRLMAYPHELSGGMRQRVAIAIAFLNNPSLVICDEPTTALDVSIQAQILVEMKKLVQESGTSLIWISHDLATVSVLASRIFVMYAGRIIEEGLTEDVLNHPRHPYTQGLINSLPSRAQPSKNLEQIPGSTPALTNLPKGCAFQDRCNYTSEKCNVSPEQTINMDRSWRCHYPITNQ